MNKTVLITGSSSGFGKLTAKLLASKGYNVYASMRGSNAKNKAIADELNQIENIKVLDLDVTDNASVNQAIATIVEKEGKIDVLVNNAGYFGGGLAENYAIEDFEAMFDVNVKGTWRNIKAVLPQMRKQGKGLIINISSGLGRFSAPFMTVYNGTKFAIEGITEGLHYEVRPLGVDVVMLQPGAFPTEIFGKSTYGSDHSINESYGELANLPANIGAGMGQMFEAMKPNPQMVPDAILKLIETPEGQRPLRTVVDGMTGQFIEDANKAVKQQYDGFLTAFGMADLLK